MRRRLKKRSQVRTSEDGVWGSVAGAEEAWRRVSAAVVGAVWRVDRGVRVVVDIDGREGCLVRSHGLSAVRKADLDGRERWETREMDVTGLRRPGWGAIRVAIVCLHPSRRLVSIVRWREVARRDTASQAGTDCGDSGM